MNWQTIGMYGLASSLGAASVLLLVFGVQYTSSFLPEWVAQLGWLVLSILASAICGFLKPERGWRWGAVVIGIQPVCMYFLMAAVGELSIPTSSTGGKVAVGIFVGMAVFVSPFTILASHTVGRERAKQLAASSPKSSASE